MIEIIARHRGTVDELQGDGMLTFWRSLGHAG